MKIEIDRRAALDLWRQVTVASVRDDGPDLSARQLAVLMTVYLTPAPHTVRGLAELLNVGKPAITRALDTLARLGYVRRRRDDADGRNVLVQRTVKGSVFLADYGDLIARTAGRLEPAALAL
ncbi:MAG: MarR family transcriptional regulator [Caulobacterales bacterium]|jgi:DNA-binding MarR family transcriptional regulator